MHRVSQEEKKGYGGKDLKVLKAWNERVMGD